jgi:hypothetical protein
MEFIFAMHRTSKFQRSPYYSCVKIFERIPNSIKYLLIKGLKNQLTQESITSTKRERICLQRTQYISADHQVLHGTPDDGIVCRNILK